MHPDTRLDAERQAPKARFVRRLLIAAAIAVAVVVALAALYAAADIFLLAFAAALVALLLRGAADWLAHRTGLGAGWSLLAVVVGLTCLLDRKSVV